MEYISKEAAITSIKELIGVKYSCMGDHDDGIRQSVNKIKHLPASDVVPVIRCRACGRGQEADDGTGIVYCCWYSREVPGNNYCGQGKPKEEK